MSNFTAWLRFNPYKKLWSIIGGRPWTYIWRDIYHTAPIVIQVLWFFVGVGVYQWIGWWGVGVFWAIYVFGFLEGHFFWGKAYKEGQQTQGEDLRYLAGVFDGEGYTGIEHNTKGWTLNVSVRTAGRTLPQLFANRFGGTLRYDTKKIDGYQYWNWQLSDNKALNFLELVVPYLKVKKPQAEVAIGFQIRKAANRGRGSTRLTPEEIDRREGEKALMKQLKRESYAA